MKTNMTYSEYTVCVGNDESNYGENCTREQAVKIADDIQRMIENQFPGINIRRTEELGSPTPTVGPDSSVIEEIDGWIRDNWTAVL